MVYPIAKQLITPFIKLWIKEINGLGNIPKEQPFVVACNHASYFEDLAVPSIIVTKLNKKIHIYVNSRYFKNFFLRKFLYWGGCIPVDVDKKGSKRNKKAFKDALTYIKKGEPFGIFPEGHRSLDGKLRKAKTGVAKIALAAKVPVIPVGFIGTYEIMPIGSKFPKFKKDVIINIGKPVYLNEYYGKENDKRILEKVTTKIMKEIAKLSNLENNF